MRFKWWELWVGSHWLYNPQCDIAEQVSELKNTAGVDNRLWKNPPYDPLASPLLTLPELLVGIAVRCQFELFW